MTGCPRGLKGDVAMREMLTSYKLALIQMDCTLFEVQANLDKAEGLVREAAAHGAKLICLPEVFQVGYFGSRIPDMMRYAEPEDGPSLTRMRALAKELEVHILAPILFSTPDGIENAAFLLDDQGELLGHYAKTHPVGDERTYLRRGSRYPVFETKLGRLGVVICYDVCFPETTRLLALSGAEVVLVPAAWRASHYFKEWWDIDLASNALDNLVYMAAVNRCGPSGEEIFAGKSQLRSPLGELLCTCGVEEEAILYGEVDLSRVAKERAFNTVLTDRHPEDYLPLSAQ